MRVAFLVAELGRSGGMAVIREYARRLDDAVLVECSGKAHPHDDGGVRVARLADMADEPPFDVAIATWWTTTEALWRLPAHRRAILLQGLDFAYFRDDEAADRLGAQAVFDLPLDWLAVSPHLARCVKLVHPGACVRLVPPGIDKSIFTPVPVPAPRPAGRPLRVLVEGQPTLWFKGVAESIAAVRRMRLPASVTLVAAEPGLAARESGADRVEGGLDQPGMAALYADHDVLLKLSRFEGLGLPVLEAFHAGLPCVVTPFGGMRGVVEHGINGLEVGFDDEPGTTAALDRLASDPALLARLREGALATAERWPSWEDAAAAFSDALKALVAADPPPVEGSLRAAADGRRRMVETTRIQEWRRRDAEGRAEWLQDAWQLADARNAEYDGWTRELGRRIDALQSRPAFRVEERLRRLGRRG